MGILNLFGIFKNPSKKVSGLPDYDPDDAGKVTWANLPANLRKRLTNQDVDLILDFEFQYQQRSGLVDCKTMPAAAELSVLNGNLNRFILDEAEKINKHYTNADINEVLKAEEAYLKQIGAMK